MDDSAFTQRDWHVISTARFFYNPNYAIGYALEYYCLIRASEGGHYS